MTKSPDAFRTIREVADWLGVAAHVLRFWESKFSQIRPVKRAGGRRYYRPSDMELVGGIKVLLHDRGMTVRGVQRMLREEGVAAVSALSPPLDRIEAASELVEGIGEEAAWARDAAAEAGATPAAAGRGAATSRAGEAEPEAETERASETGDANGAAPPPEAPAPAETPAAAVPGSDDMSPDAAEPREHAEHAEHAERGEPHPVAEPQPVEPDPGATEPVEPQPVEPEPAERAEDATEPSLPGFFRHTTRGRPHAADAMRTSEGGTTAETAETDAQPEPRPSPPGAAASLDRLAAIAGNGTGAADAAAIADLRRLRDRIGRPVEPAQR